MLKVDRENQEKDFRAGATVMIPTVILPSCFVLPISQVISDSWPHPTHILYFLLRGEKLFSLSTKDLNWSQWLTSSTGLSFVTDTSFQNWETRGWCGCSYYAAPLSSLRNTATLYICALSSWDSVCHLDWTLVREDICFNISLCLRLFLGVSLLFLLPLHCFSHFHVSLCCACVYVCLDTCLWGGPYAPRYQVDVRNAIVH